MKCQSSNILQVLAIFAIAACTQGKTVITAPVNQPVYVQVGQSFTLTCRQEDGENVDWYKDTTKIDAQLKSHFSIVGKRERDTKGNWVTVSDLTKTNITIDDGTNYECRPRDNSMSYILRVFVFSIKGKNYLMEFAKTAELGCDMEGQTNIGKPVTWYRNDEAIVIDKVKYDTYENNNTLRIHKATEKDTGMYVCGFQLENSDNHTEKVYLNAKPHVKEFEPKSKNLVQGDPLVLNCKVWAYPRAIVMWYREDDPIDPSKDDRITLKNAEDGTVNASLRIDNLDFDDRANYVCVATNDFGTSNSTIMVRVKDKYAALWPFLGICAEVVVLCVIIFIYERRRAKKLDDEDTPEEAGHLTNSNDNNLRHRK